MNSLIFVTFSSFALSVADMVTLQNLQNLAHIRNLPQVASLAAGLQGLTNNQLINTPLNLTVSSSGRDTKSSAWTDIHKTPTLLFNRLNYSRSFFHRLN